MKKLNDFANKYSYQLEYDQDDSIFIGRCAELPLFLLMDIPKKKL